MREEGLLAGAAEPLDSEVETSLRPRHLDEFVGQERLKERLRIAIEAARMLGRPLDHVLFSGPPGLGKTTLAGILAAETSTRLRITSGPALERPADLAAIVSNLDDGDVFFIDEIHRLPRAVEEVLYPAMEDFQLDIVVGKGASAQSIRIDLARFTLVGATTRMGKVTAPLRDRFGIADKLEYYQPEELEQILGRASGILDADLTPDGAEVIGTRSRGDPADRHPPPRPGARLRRRSRRRSGGP